MATSRSASRRPDRALDEAAGQPVTPAPGVRCRRLPRILRPAAGRRMRGSLRHRTPGAGVTGCPAASSRARSGLLEADLDVAIADTHRERGLWSGRGAARHRSVGEAETAAVPWAGDTQLVVDLALVQRAAGVVAAGRDRVDEAAVAVE